MRLADLPIDPAMPPRVREAERDERGRVCCPDCGGGLYMPAVDRHRCRVCEATYAEMPDDPAQDWEVVPRGRDFEVMKPNRPRR